MNILAALHKSKTSKIVGLALIAASLISFVASTEAATTHSLTVNVSDACGPVQAQVTVVNGPDDGAFGITTNGQFIFPSLNDGVFYLHITADGHASKDTDAIVLTSNQTVNISLDRNDANCGGPVDPPQPGTHNLTVNVTDVCGPVVAQIVVVNGPDDGAFGITNSNGQFVFPSLHDGVFYLHITAANHASKDTGAIVLTSNQTVNVTLDRTNGGCNPPNNPVCEDPHANNFGGPLPCTYPPTGPTNNPPAGVLDAANCDLIGGWAVDNDTPNQAVTIEVYMDGPAGSGTLVATVQANINRLDVGNHAFHIQPIPAQLRDGHAHRVYAYMLDTTSGAKSLLTNGVKDIPVCGTPPTANRPPVGVFDAATCDIIGGWAFDPDESSKSIVVEIYANGPQGIGTRIFSGATTGLRPDVNAQYGITGNHGFTISTPQSLKDGNTHEIWVYAQDSTTNVNTLFDNRKFLNTASCVPPTNHAPTGVLDVANCEIIGGWSVDMDTPNTPGLVDLYYDGPAGSGTFLATVPANTLRPDVNAQFGITGNHGFTFSTPAVLKNTQSHTIYAYAIDTDPSHSLNFHLINSPKTIPACVTTAGTINLVKLVRNVTAGQSAFATSTSANPGDQVEFQLQVSVLGSTVTNVVLTDTLPSRLTYINNSLTVDGTPSGNSLSGLSLGSINGSQTKLVVLRATVADASQFSAGNTTLVNTGSVTSSANSMQSSASVVVSYTPPTAGTISIVKTVRNVTQNQNAFVSTTSANPGDTVEFRIQATATGGAVSNAIIRDDLPLRLNYVNNSLTIENASGNNNLASINLGNLTANQTKTVLLRATVAQAALFTTGNTILINSAIVPATNAISSASVAVNITPTNVTLTIVKLARNVSQGQSGFSKNISANPGDTVQFQLQVSNSGNVVAQNVSVQDTLPNNLSLASGFSTTFNLGTMNVGSSQTMTLNAIVAGEASFACGGNTLTNIATAQASNSNFPSDQATVSVTRNCVNNTGTLTLVKEVRNLNTNNSFSNSTNASVGDQVQFRITVRNVSNVTVNNVRVSDFLPNGLIYVPGTFQVDSGSTSGNLFSGNQFLGNIFSGQSRVITFNATVNAGASQTITNVAQVFADNASSVNAQASVVVGSVLGGNINLVLSKRAFNQTQNVNATQVTAKAGDIIVYTLSVQNQGNVTATNYVFQDNLADVLQLSMLNDFGGASFDLGTLTVTWPQVSINAGQTVEKTFSVKVNSTFPAGSDNVMTNVFGNTLNVVVLKPVVAGITAPPTGTTTNVIFLLSTLSIAGFATYRRKDQLKNFWASAIK